DGVAGDTTGGGIEASCGRISGTHASMAQLTARLSRELGRPVLNQSSLDGRYTFHFEWTPDVGPCSTGTAPSMFTAIQEQLGLRLESIKGLVDVVVVDHAEAPTPD